MIVNFEPIGICHTDYNSKFGIPRQPGLCPDARGVIELRPDAQLVRAVSELTEFSHIWVIFCFHATGRIGWRPTIRPPRFGGAKRIGVLSTRSPHRPNPIGMSVVKLEAIEVHGAVARIVVSGVDILDKSPVLDVKPYIKYADAVLDANSGWAVGGFEVAAVTWSEEAREAVVVLLSAGQSSITSLTDMDAELDRRYRVITQVVAQDPRPAMQQRKLPLHADESEGLCFGVELFGWDVRFRIRAKGFHIFEITSLALYELQKF
jgi:tRNA (adenine37-N6)-methyltransferase